MILEGCRRIELAETVRYRPYRVHRLRSLGTPPPCDTVRVDALVAKVRELVQHRLDLGLPWAFPVMHSGRVPETPEVTPANFLDYLESLPGPGEVADAVCCAMLGEADERQTLLETVEVETRLRRLIGFLLPGVRPAPNGPAD